MRTLEEIKTDYANSKGYEYWEDFELNVPKTVLSNSINIISVDFAKEKVNEALDKAANEAKVRMFNRDLEKPTGIYFVNEDRGYEVDKKSILKLKS